MAAAEAVQGLYGFNLVLNGKRERHWVGDPAGQLELAEFGVRKALVYQSMAGLPEGLEPDQVRSAFGQFLLKVGLKRVEPKNSLA